MSLYLDTPLCASNYANTGVDSCYLVPGMIVGAIAIPATKTFTAADVVDFKTTLQALTLDDDPAQRIFPLFRFEGIEDGSEDSTIESLGYGGKQYVKQGTYDFKFRYVKGGACLNKLLSGADLNAYKWLLVDSNNVIFGTATSTGLLAGLSTNFVQALPMKFNDGSTAAQFKVHFNFSKPSELNRDMMFVQCDFNVDEEVKGLIDVEIREVDAIDNELTVKLLTNCGKIDLYDSYSTELSGTGKNLWVLTKSGSPVSITSVTANASTKDFTVVFTGTGTHVLNLEDPATLAAADVGGYPGNGYDGIALTADCSGS